MSLLEKLQIKKSFTDLIHLREELTKEAQNKERLTEYQKTIDLALEQGKKKGVIEFTEAEWKTLISNENLPPFEEVQALLQEKITSAKEVTSETKEKTGGIMEELQQKAEGMTGEAQKKIEELKQKAEDLKKYSKPGLWLLGIGLSLKLWGYKIANWFSGLFGKKGEYDEKIKLAEMEKEFLENPEAAMKKYGADALEKMKGRKVEQKEGGVLEKVGPLALLGGTGAGIFALLKNKLPASVTGKLEGLEGKSFLAKIAKNRALRLFGISGIVLFGIGKLYEHIENNGASLGEMPADDEEKKSWWKKAIESAGIGIKEGAEEIWSLINGEKLDEYLTERENKTEMEERGYVTLEEHPSIIGAKRELGIFEKRCEVFFNENRQAFEAAVAAGLIMKPGMVLATGAKGASIALSILKFAAPGTIIPAGIILALLGNAFEGIKHIQVPKNLGPEDIKDLFEIPDIKDFLEKQLPGITDTMHFESITQEMETLEQKIKDFNAKEFWDKIAGGAAEMIIESPQEKINSTNKQGIDSLISNLELREREEQKPGLYGQLIGNKEKPGILQEVSNKLGAGNALTENDIRLMMEATSGTNIHIMPRDGIKTGTTIQWVLRDTYGNHLGLPRNICVNPTIEYSLQYETARDFIVDEYDLSTMNVIGKIGGGMREKVSEVAESIRNNHEQSGNLMESLIQDVVSIATIGLETFAIDYLGNKYLLGPWNLVQSAFLNMDNPEDKLEMQEGLVEYGQGLAPVILIAGIKRGIQRKGFGILGWKLLLESVTYPLHIAKQAGKGSLVFGKYIYERIFAGDYKAVFSDPKNQFSAYLRENIHKFKWLQNVLPGDTARRIRGHHANISKLEEARKLLYDAKQSSFSRSHKLEEAIKILEKESESFEKLVGSRNIDDNSIKSILTKLETEIVEQRKLLSILENGVRQTFSQALANRTAEVQSLKGFDISTEQGKKDAEKMLLESQEEIENMEKDRVDIEKEITEMEKKVAADPNNTALQQALADKKKVHMNMMVDYDTKHRDLSEIREAMGELLHGRKPRIRIGESHIRSVKGLRGSAKVLGIIALTVGAGVGIEKITQAIHGDSSEIQKGQGYDEDTEKYYGFRKEKNIVSNGITEQNEYTCASPEEFEKRIVAIETQYTESINKFFDPEFVNSLSGEEREQKIQEAADGHMIRVDAIKSLIGSNKDMMEAYWNKKFTSEGIGEEIVPEDIRQQGVKAFMFIHRKDGELTLEYMNHQEMKNVFYTLYDAAHTSFLEGTLGEKGAMAADMTLRVAPFTGSFMDGKDAYESFSRGNIGDGIMSTAWCIGGLALDIGGFFSFGGSTAAGVALRTGKVGVRIAQTTGKALLHNGVQLGTQFGMKLAESTRSESVSIRDIPEPVTISNLLP